MGLFGARKTVKVGRWRGTVSAQGATVSGGSRRARLAVSSNGRNRASVNILRGLRWSRQAKR